MNPDNIVTLGGVIHDDPREGANWTRYRPSGGRAQIRFWLAVSRELAGDGIDLLLCAIEPTKPEEIQRYPAELRSGRTVHLQACARSLADPREDNPGVIFVALEAGFDGAPAHNVHQMPRKHALHGKSAAAGDRDEAELELQLKA